MTLISASAISPDGLLNAGVSLFVGFVATLAAFAIAIYQRHQGKTAERQVAAERRRADDATERLETARLDELERWRAEAARAQKELRDERAGGHHDV